MNLKSGSFREISSVARESHPPISTHELTHGAERVNMGRLKDWRVEINAPVWLLIFEEPNNKTGGPEAYVPIPRRFQAVDTLAIRQGDFTP